MRILFIAISVPNSLRYGKNPPPLSAKKYSIYFKLGFIGTTISISAPLYLQAIILTLPTFFK